LPTPTPAQRKYLPTLSDLIDRYTIVRLKSIFIPEHRAEYAAELALISHDIKLTGAEQGIPNLDVLVDGISMTMLTNRYIWENEGKARLGRRGQEKLLKLTHSINGVRNTAKNLLARLFGERMDWKVDCFAEELVEEFGNWNVWGLDEPILHGANHPDYQRVGEKRD
jgi:hypothetical protein